MTVDLLTSYAYNSGIDYVIEVLPNNLYTCVNRCSEFILTRQLESCLLGVKLDDEITMYTQEQKYNCQEFQFSDSLNPKEVRLKLPLVGFNQTLKTQKENLKKLEVLIWLEGPMVVIFDQLSSC